MVIARTRKQLIALVALAAFVFAQAAVAVMGCATLRADPARGAFAVMPSGEPCEMMGAAPAALALEHLLPDAGLGSGDTSPHFAAFVAVTPVLAVVPAEGRPAPARFDHAARILGPPPFRLTQRVRI